MHPLLSALAAVRRHTHPGSSCPATFPKNHTRRLPSPIPTTICFGEHWQMLLTPPAPGAVKVVMQAQSPCTSHIRTVPSPLPVSRTSLGGGASSSASSFFSSSPSAGAGGAGGSRVALASAVMALVCPSRRAATPQSLPIFCHTRTRLSTHPDTTRPSGSARRQVTPSGCTDSEVTCHSNTGGGGFRPPGGPGGGRERTGPPR
mmetsp:Transcript_44298/g.140972  ORF Transcript_44298/g.140972 Transcript_44298/m.140972 type:complete len:203 (-) Transcript_44298:46-654(-)